MTITSNPRFNATLQMIACRLPTRACQIDVTPSRTDGQSEGAGSPLVPSSYGDPSLLLLYRTPCEWMPAGKRMRLRKTTWISSPTSARMVGPRNPRCSSAAVRSCKAAGHGCGFIRK